MSYVMDFKDMFYIQPEVIKPQSFGTAEVTWYEYVNNNGIIYRRENRESGYPKYGVAVKGEYGSLLLTFLMRQVAMWPGSMTRDGNVSFI